MDVTSASGGAKRCIAHPAAGNSSATHPNRPCSVPACRRGSPSASSASSEPSSAAARSFARSYLGSPALPPAASGPPCCDPGSTLADASARLVGGGGCRPAAEPAVPAAPAVPLWLASSSLPDSLGGAAAGGGTSCTSATQPKSPASCTWWDGEDGMLMCKPPGCRTSHAGGTTRGAPRHPAAFPRICTTPLNTAVQLAHAPRPHLILCLRPRQVQQRSHVLALVARARQEAGWLGVRKCLRGRSRGFGSRPGRRR